MIYSPGSDPWSDDDDGDRCGCSLKLGSVPSHWSSRSDDSRGAAHKKNRDARAASVGRRSASRSTRPCESQHGWKNLSNS